MAKVCKFQLEKEMVSYDCGQIWSPTGNKRKIPGQDPVEKPSEDCGWTGIFEYKWETDDTGFTCNGYDKYSTKVQYLSYDQGETWSKVEGSEQIGTLLEQFSSDCCYIRNITGTSFCTCDFQQVNGTLEEASLDEELWVYTGRYHVDEVVDDFPVDCFKLANTLSGICTFVQYIDGTNHFDTGSLSIDETKIKKIYYGCNETYKTHTYTEIPDFKNTLEKIYFGEDFEDSYIDGFYWDCKKLTELNGLENTHISAMCATFEGCTGLTAVTLPTTCKKVAPGKGAAPWNPGFRNTSIKSINLENCTYGLSNYAFADCTGLTAVTLPPYFETFSPTTDADGLGGSVFAGCTSLPNVVIPSGCPVSVSMFEGCTSLTSVTFEGRSVSVDDFGFKDCGLLGSLNYKPGCVIGGGAFYNCTGLTSVTLKEFGWNCGYGGGGSLEIAYDGNSVPYGAFEGCSNLTSITFENTIPPQFNGAGSEHPEHYQHMFANTNNCPIYVPAESVETYKSASGWSYFADRIQAIPNS